MVDKLPFDGLCAHYTPNMDLQALLAAGLPAMWGARRRSWVRILGSKAGSRRSTNTNLVRSQFALAQDLVQFGPAQHL